MEFSSVEEQFICTTTKETSVTTIRCASAPWIRNTALVEKQLEKYKGIENG
jgi:hypothetical protein